MKGLAAALLAANLLVLAWWQGYLSPLWEPPGSSEREPLRMSRQLRPDAVRVEPARAKGAASPVPGLAASAAASAVQAASGGTPR